MESSSLNLTQQDEETLLCNVATSKDMGEAYRVLHSPGWATLMTILQESGERPPKRRTPTPPTAHLDGEHLAKRFKGVSLN
jgi:nuclear protein localization protein 4 homolog